MAQDTKVITLSLGSIFFIIIVLGFVGTLGGYAGSKFAQPRQLQQVVNGTNTIVPVSQSVTISPSKNFSDIATSRSKSVLLLAHESTKGITPFSMGVIITSDGIVLAPVDGGAEGVLAIGENSDTTPLTYIGKDSLTGMHLFRMQNKVVVPVELAQKTPAIGATFLQMTRISDTMHIRAEVTTLSQFVPPLQASGLGINQLALMQSSKQESPIGSPLFDEEGRLAGIMRANDHTAVLISDIQQLITRLSSNSLTQNSFTELGFAVQWKVQEDAQSNYTMRATVASVTLQSITARAGLKIGDVLSAINGSTITWDSNVHAMLQSNPVLLTILRQEETSILTLTR